MNSEKSASGLRRDPWDSVKVNPSSLCLCEGSTQKFCWDDKQECGAFRQASQAVRSFISQNYLPHSIPVSIGLVARGPELQIMSESFLGMDRGAA